MDARKFFELLFADAVDQDNLISVVGLPGPTSSFHSNSASAADAVAQLRDGSDCYSGVGLYRSGIAKGRGKAADVRMIPGLWADIDIYDPVHKKAEHLPREEDHALEMLHELGRTPSIVIHSGHGLQCWWLFPEPEEVSEEARRLVLRFDATIRHIFKSHNYTLDAVHDISRIMRVPGTFNRKRPDAVKEVYCFQGDGSVRWTMDDLDSVCMEDAELARPATKITPVQMPATSEQLAELRAWWEGIREVRTISQVLAGQRGSKPSLSEDDASLLKHILQLDPEVTDSHLAFAIFQHRKMHGKTDKDINKGADTRYIARTIAFVRSGQVTVSERIPEPLVLTEPEEPDVPDVPEPPPAAPEPTKPESEPESENPPSQKISAPCPRSGPTSLGEEPTQAQVKARRKASKLLTHALAPKGHPPLQKIVRSGDTSDMIYEFVFGDASFRIGSSDLHRHTAVAQAVLDQMRHYPFLTSKNWVALLTHVPDLLEDGSLVRYEDRVEAAVLSYIRMLPRVEDLPTEPSSCIHEETIWVEPGHCGAALDDTYKVKAVYSVVCSTLASLGFSAGSPRPDLPITMWRIGVEAHEGNHRATGDRQDNVAGERGEASARSGEDSAGGVDDEVGQVGGGEAGSAQ